MNNYEKLYWLTRLDNFQFLLFTLLFICGCVLFFYWIGYFINSDFEDDFEDYKEKFGGKAKLCTWIGVISALILTFLPSKDDAVLIFAGGKTMDFVEKDSSINKIPAQTTKIISQYLDKSIKEIENAKGN